MTTMPASPATAPAVPGTPAADLLAAASGAVALGNAPASQNGAGFLALVQQALHLVNGGTGTPQDGAVAQDGTEKGEQDATTDADGSVDGAVAGLATVLPFLPNLALQVAAPVAAAPGTSTGTSTGTTATTTGAVAGAGAATTAPSAGAAAGLHGKDPRSTGPADHATSTDAATDGAQPTAGGPDHAAATPPAETPVAAPSTPAPSTGTTQPIATAATAPTAAAAPAATPATPALDPVTTQVVDKVTSMADRGTGTHRVTMKLNPEQLGEVRIVMTVRDGAVHVRLAASEHHAHQALLDGSPDLNRLLEAAGHTDARITVRETGRGFAGDLDQGSSNGWASQGSGTPGQDAGEGRASGRSPNEHAGTRAEQVATDGTHDSRRFAAGPTGTRSNESVTSSRVSGLDVTM